MIGFVLTGHGEFCLGLGSALEMIGGVQKQFEKVVFLAENPLEQLEADLREAVAKVDSGDGVIVFTDIKGGTPFNKAVSLALGYDKVHVIAGTNLPMLLEGSFMRSGVEDLKIFVDQLVEIGLAQLMAFEKFAEAQQELDDI